MIKLTLGWKLILRKMAGCAGKARTAIPQNGILRDNGSALAETLLPLSFSDSKFVNQLSRLPQHLNT